MDNETLVDSGLDMVSRMDTMMTMLWDLTNKVNGQMDSPHPSPLKARPEVRRSRWQNTSSQDLDLDLDETIQRRVTQCLRQIPLLAVSTSQEDSSSDDELVVKRKKKLSEIR